MGLLVVLWGAPGEAAAQSSVSSVSAGLARVPVQVIEGKLVVACEVSTSRRRLPLNLFFDYESKCGLQLHNQAAAGIRCENQDGSTIPITVHFGEFSVTVDRREHGDEDFYDDFTKYHSVALGENAAAATLGSEVLSNYYVVFDLANGFLHIGDPRPEDPQARDEVEGQVVLPLTEINGLAWASVRHADGLPGAMAIGSARYDSTVDYTVCDRFAKPAGDLESLRLGGIELTEFLALRPEEVVQVHPDGVVGVLGLNFLEHFRVEVDRVNRTARVSQTMAANFPEDDLAFFRARAEDDADSLQAFLAEYPKVRTSREAAELLLAMRLDEDADAESSRLALQCINDTYPEDLRATAMLDQVIALRQVEQPELAIVAGEIGIPAGRADRYPNSVHKLHAQVGEIQLDQGDREPAWEHLLSAAFGMPEDGMINYQLGRFYEAEGRMRRAYSRYVQAVIKPDSGPLALTALHRLEGRMGGDERMSVDRIERLTAGKTHAFGAATTYRPKPEEQTNRRVLIEFFTNANLGDAARGGSIGGALGNDGLVSHFTKEHAAFITWHLMEPELVPMTIEAGSHRAALVGAGPTVHVINGIASGPGAAKWRDKEKVYNRCRQLAVDAMARPSDFEIELEAKVDQGRLTGTAKVRGPTDRRVRVHLVLVERGVLFPGRSEIVIHRNVARASLTKTANGERFRPQDGVMQIPFEASLDEIRSRNEAWLDELMASGQGNCVKISMAIDPEQVDVVAFVRASDSGEVLQALQVEAAQPEERK
ncbi:MAG: hypothetical protein VYE77_09615 [Planctomycetota bacterium]|nr:hypothetical protein [Planctomycetota bacterium]